MIDDIVDLNC